MPFATSVGSGPLIDLQGRLLPMADAAPTEPQRCALEEWQALAARSPVEPLACLEASSALHLALLPIDAVAWNRIPAAPEPLLLEGNSGFHTLDLGEDGHPMNAEPL